MFANVSARGADRIAVRESSQPINGGPLVFVEVYAHGDAVASVTLDMRPEHAQQLAEGLAALGFAAQERAA